MWVKWSSDQVPCLCETGLKPSLPMGLSSVRSGLAAPSLQTASLSTARSDSPPLRNRRGIAILNTWFEIIEFAKVTYCFNSFSFS